MRCGNKKYSDSSVFARSQRQLLKNLWENIRCLKKQKNSTSNSISGGIFLFEYIITL